mgnify:CR=1 FL=1
MSYNDALRLQARRVLVAQAVLTLALAVGFGLVQGKAELLAALYGGLITLLITGWLAWRLRRLTAQTQGAGVAMIYSSAAVRYGVAALMVGAGVGALRLAPLPLLASFAVTQFGFLAAPRARPGIYPGI